MAQQLFAASTELDLEKLVTIPLIFKISDIRDISKKSSAYSKTIVLPGTRVNNEFFGGLYDFNADFTVFNPNIKTPILFVNEGQPFMSGYMQLKMVSRNDKHKVNYHVVIYDNIGNFWQDLGKKTQADLDWTVLNHVYRYADIVASWTNTWTDGYYYPMLYNNSQDYVVTDWKPAIFEKWLLDKILADEGLTWSGNLKTSPEFANEIILNDIAQPSISPAIATSKTFKATKTTSESIYINNNNQMSFGAGLFNLPFTTDDEITTPNFDTNNLWNAVNTFTATVGGLYKLKVTDLNIKTVVDWFVPNAASNQNPDNAYLRHKLDAVVYDNLNNVVEVIFVSWNYVQTFLPVGAPVGVPQQTIFNTNLQAATVTSAINFGNIFLDVGWRVEFVVEVVTWALNFPKTTVTQTESFAEPNFSVSSEYLLYAYSDNSPLSMSDFINKKFELKQIILDIIARYNCFVYQNPEDENDIVFQIRDQFYATGTVLDWTDKKDYNTIDKIKLIGELQSEEMILSYSKGSDETNKGYTLQIGENNIFGQFEYRFGSEFVKGKKKITSPFVPTPLLWQPINGAIVPAINSQGAIKGMRILYKGGTLRSAGQFQVTWGFNYRQPNGQYIIAAQFGYPYAGHLNNPLFPTLDINFGALPFPSLYYAPFQTTENNLYNRYWRNTINQIADGRMVISKFNLTANDVHFIKTNPNTKLFIENTYYYINKIQYEANEGLRKLTTIELITVEDELTFEDDTPIVISGDISGDISLPFLDIPITGHNPSNTVATDGDLSNRIAGTDNYISEKSANNIINGNGNFIDSKRSGNFINGNNNRIFGSNNVIIGNSGLTIRGDNISIINGVVTDGCLSSVIFNKIDGGIDALTNGGNCNIVKINSQLDGKFNEFNVNLFNLINSVDGETTEITDFFN